MKSWIKWGVITLTAWISLSVYAAENPRVKMSTSEGDVIIELNAQKAPVSTQNFVEYTQSKFYDGTIFHRVIPDFMVQGGGFLPNMEQKPTQAPIKNEAANGLKNKRGTLAMARTQDINSATAQFFINLKDNDFLDHQSGSAAQFGYAVFGQVVEGMEVVDKMAKVPTGRSGAHADVPLQPIFIKSMQIIKNP